MSTLVFLVAVAMTAERCGAPVTLNLNFKGDLKRESRWFAQYGQGACVLMVALVIWRLDGRRLRWNLNPAVLLATGVFSTSLIAMVIKRTLGRVRPGREEAGRFLGPSWKHHNYRESFPSSHSACAVAMSLLLSLLYPPAAVVFWALAMVTALLRYLMDAHWPSDVLAGVALGYSVAWLVWQAMGA